MDNKYTTSDIVATLGVSVRTAQRYVENLVNKENNKLYFNKDVFDLIIERHTNDKEATDSNNDLIEQYFTEEEYEEFQKRLIEYPLIIKNIIDLKNQIEYHKKQYSDLMQLHEQFLQMHKITLQNISQRNFIEAKEKKLDE